MKLYSETITMEQMWVNMPMSYCGPPRVAQPVSPSVSRGASAPRPLAKVGGFKPRIVS